MLVVQFIVTFVAMAITDALYAAYTRRTAEGRAFSAGTYAALLLVTGGVVVVLYTSNPVLLIAAAAGAFVGTYLTVRADTA